MVAIAYDWPAGKWLFQGLMASVFSGVGFVFLTLAFEYGKRYRRQRREREQQVILEKLLRGDVVLEFNNPQAVVPVNKGCVLRDLSASRRGSFLISNYKQRGGFLGVGRGYYARRNRPEDESNSDPEFIDNRITYSKCSNVIRDSSQLGDNGNKSSEPAVRLIPSDKTSFAENKDEARIFQNLINSQSTLSINNFKKKESGEPVQKDVSQTHMCKKMCEEMCYRIVKEHPFIAPFIRRDLLQELKLEVTPEPKVSNSGATYNLTEVPKRWVQLCQPVCPSPTNETTPIGVKSTPKIKNRVRSMSRGPLTKMRNTPIQLETLVQKTSMAGVSKKTDWVLSKKSNIRNECQTPNNITGTAHKSKLLKNVKSRRSYSLCHRTPLNDHVSFTQISKLAQDAKSIPKESATNLKENKFANYEDNGSSVDPMTTSHAIITEHPKDEAECTKEMDLNGDGKLAETLGRENSECTNKQSARCLSGTGNKGGTEGRINEIVSALTSWGYSIKNKVQGKENGSTNLLQDTAVNEDTRPASDKQNTKENAEIAKLNSRALIDLIKNLAESRKNRKLLRQISSVLSTNKTPVRLSRNSKSSSKTQISPAAATTGTPVTSTDKTPGRLTRNAKSFSKTQISPVTATTGTLATNTSKTPGRLSRNSKSSSKTQISPVTATTGTPVTSTDKTPVRLTRNSKSSSKTQILPVTATTGTPVTTTNKTPVRLTRNSKSFLKTQTSPVTTTTGTPVTSTDKTPVKLTRNSKSFSKTQLSPVVATTGTPEIVQSPGFSQESNDKKNSSVVSDAGSKVLQDIKKSPVVKRRRIVRERSYFAKLASTYKKDSDSEHAFYQTSVLPSSQSKKSSPPKLENEIKENLRRSTTPQKRYRKLPKSINLKRLVINKMEPRALKKTIRRTQTRRHNSAIHQGVATKRDNLEVVAGIQRSKDCSESDSENPQMSQMEEQSNTKINNTRIHKVGNEVIDHAEKGTQVEEIIPFSTTFSENITEHSENNNDMEMHQDNEIENKLQTVDLCITNEAFCCQFSQYVNIDNVQEVLNDNVADEALKVNPVKEENSISQNRDFILSGVKEAAIRDPVTFIKQRKVENQKEQKSTILTRTQSKYAASNKVKKSSQSGAIDCFSEIHTFKPAQRQTYATSRKSASVVKSNPLSKQPTSGNKGGNKKLQHEVEKAERHIVSVKTKPKEQQTRTVVKRGHKKNESTQPIDNKTRENSHLTGKAGKPISNEIRSRYEQYQKNKLQKNAPLRKRKSPVNIEVKVELNENINRASLQHIECDSDPTSDYVGQLHKINTSPLLHPTSVTNRNRYIESETSAILVSSLEAESKHTNFHQTLDSCMSFENDHSEAHSDREDVAWGTTKSGNTGQQSFTILKKSKLDIVVGTMLNARSIFRTTDT